MSTVIETRYCRLADGRPATVRIEVDEDQTPANPRKNDTTLAVLVTNEFDYTSPDHRNGLPSELDEALNRWSDSVSTWAHLIKRYASIFHADSILYVGGIMRNGYEGALSLDDSPESGARYVGIAVVTRDGLKEAGEPIELDAARECAQQEIERYSEWAIGHVYGYVVETVKPGGDIDTDPEVIDSCWGYVGDDEIPYMFQCGKENFDDGFEEIDQTDFYEMTER